MGEEIIQICPHCGAKDRLGLIQNENVGYWVALTRHEDGEIEHEIVGTEDSWWSAEVAGFHCLECGEEVDLSKLKCRGEAEVLPQKEISKELLRHTLASSEPGEDSPLECVTTVLWVLQARASGEDYEVAVFATEEEARRAAYQHLAMFTPRRMESLEDSEEYCFDNDLAYIEISRHQVHRKKTLGGGDQ